MENPETRLLEEWKANNDLAKFHEDLKQKRFAYFLTIQTAFLAIFGLLARETLGDLNPVRLLGLVVVSVPALFIASYFIRIDARARAYVDTVKGKLLLIEEEWRQLFPTNHFSTYKQQFAILVHRKPEMIDKYLAVRGLVVDPFATLINTKAAHVGEETILRLFQWLWGILLALAGTG
ncbi:MAG: hypothetical protein HYZ00_14090, partial [Candidatus Hydrogenedentes bacterium]|nr:hypothetical protein [Candidatus Hydrogenedentota bacterium]